MSSRAPRESNRPSRESLLESSPQGVDPGAEIEERPHKGCGQEADRRPRLRFHELKLSGDGDRNDARVAGNWCPEGLRSYSWLVSKTENGMVS